MLNLLLFEFFYYWQPKQSWASRLVGGNLDLIPSNIFYSNLYFKMAQWFTYVISVDINSYIYFCVTTHCTMSVQCIYYVLPGIRVLYIHCWLLWPLILVCGPVTQLTIPSHPTSNSSLRRGFGPTYSKLARQAGKVLSLQWFYLAHIPLIGLYDIQGLLWDSDTVYW